MGKVANKEPLGLGVVRISHSSGLALQYGSLRPISSTALTNASAQNVVYGILATSPFSTPQIKKHDPEYNPRAMLFDVHYVT